MLRDASSLVEERARAQECAAGMKNTALFDMVNLKER
jgi:hypothetical protein